MNTNTLTRGLQALIACLCLLAAWPSNAAPMNFAQVPAGSSAREPAPNVIVSVDDSGSMLAAGMSTLKAALTQTFSVNNVADGRIRLAWNSMNTCRSISTNGGTPANCGSYNGIASLEGDHRANFLNWVTNTLPAIPPNSNLTPSHLMMRTAGEYLRTTGQYSPYRSTPGSTTNATELSCRKSFNIFMTDGAWNTYQEAPYSDGYAIAVGGGNADGLAKVLPDGTPYDPASEQTNVYSDGWGVPALSTLSDVAFHYWSTDLQTGLPNNVRASMPQASTETIGAVSLQPYWNPKNNPANWQHMTTYSIGFNAQATTWLGSPTYTVASGMYGGPGYTGLVNGNQTWVSPLCSAGGGSPDTVGGNTPCDNATGKWQARVNYRSSELWHMALNGRGQFVPAPDAQSLVTAFQTILNDILTQTSRPVVSIATSSSRASAGGFAYVAGYNSEANWSGSLGAYAINSSTSLPSTTATWRAETLMDASSFSVSDRVVLTHNGTQGVGFQWDNLSNNQRLAIQGSNVAGTGTARISYLRGSRSLEGTAGYMRTRSSRLGDIVNSNIWHTGAPSRMAIDLPGHAAFRAANASRVKTVWVGANDGMLHGFNGQTGQEVLAYVPLGLYGTTTSSPLRDLTSPAYSHRYYVDGHPFTGDVNVNTTGTPDWRTLLVGTLGAGGKGYFVLDVTNATNFVDPGVAASSVVLLDRTATTDADIGHVFAAPVVDELTRSRSEQIVRVNDGGTSGYRWAVILGNGYNSTSERPVLLIQYLDGTRQLRRIVASATLNQGNGLGAPRTVDLNGNGTVDLVYAGDLQGNLWKFDLTSSDPLQWRVAFGGNAFYTARDNSSTPQPITAAPIWKVGPDGTGVQVMFGTGRSLVASDLESSAVQTVYSLWDQSRYSWSATSTTVTGTDATRVTGSRLTTLVRQTQNTATAGDVFFSTSTNGVAYSRSNTLAPRGWYFDFPAAGERVLNHPVVFERNLIRVVSVVPTSSAEGETCNLTTNRGAGYLSIFDIYSGRPPTYDVYGEGNGNRVLYGSGEYATLDDKQQNKETIFDKKVTCTGSECDECVGAECGCTGTGCGVDGVCGGLKGKSLEACYSGVNGVRSDWREIR